MATRYVDHPGSGTACSQTTRCSMQTALSQAQPSDLISLASGTLASPKLYTGSASMIVPPSGKSGTSSAPIMVKAEVDGGVLLDGQFGREPISLRNNAWWVIEGMNARHGNAGVVRIGEGTSNIIVRRVVGWDAAIHKNNAIFSAVLGAQDVLFEDIAAFGTARVPVNNFDARRITYRRVWARYEGSIQHNPVATVQIVYRSYDITWDNAILEFWGGMMPQNGTQTDTSGNPTSLTFTNWSTGGNTQPTVIGTGHFIGIANKCTNSRANGFFVFALNGARRLSSPNGITAGFRFMDCYRYSHIYTLLDPALDTSKFFANWWLDGGGEVANLTDVRASNISSVAPSGLQDIVRDGAVLTSYVRGTSTSAVPNPWTNTGSGANLCFRWVNRVLTTTPLWPWPMNARIKAATAMAGNYFANGGPGCGPTQGNCSGTGANFGTLTRTETDVTARVESVLGTIPSQCKAGSVGTLVLNVSPTTLTFNVTQGGPSDAKTVTVTNSGTGGPMPWSVTKSASLTMVALSPTSRSDAGTFTATATAPSSLAAGQYTGTLTVSASGASGSPQVIGVTVNVAASPPPPAPTPTLALSPTSLTFDVVAGGSPVTKGVAVNNTTADSGPMSWSASANQSFVSLSPTSAPDVGTLNVTVNPAELVVGTRSAVVTVQANANNSPQTVGVTVNVAAAPVVAALALSQTAFTFRGQADATLPAQSLTIENSGDGGSIAWTASDNATWLGLSATSGVTPATIQLLVSTLGLAVGTHTATISVASTSASNSPQTASVTLIVDPPPAEEEPTEPEVPPEDDPLPEPDPVPPEKPGKGHGRERAPGRLKKLIQSTTSALLVIVGAEGEFMHATLETDVGDEVDDG